MLDHAKLTFQREICNLQILIPRPSAVFRIPEKAPTSATPNENKRLSETEIIRRAQDGDEAMFEHLYRLHCRRVYAVCLRLVKDPSEAEDLTQEAFLLLVKKITTFRGESAFSTWLHRLTINRVLMHLRKKSLQVVSLEAVPDPHDESVSLSIDIGMPDLMNGGNAGPDKSRTLHFAVARGLSDNICFA